MGEAAGGHQFGLENRVQGNSSPRLSNELDLQKWQRWLNPIERVLGDGCRLDLDVEAVVRGQAFGQVEVTVRGGGAAENPRVDVPGVSGKRTASGIAAGPAADGPGDGSASAGRPDLPGGSCSRPAVVEADRAGVSDRTGFRHQLTVMTPWFTPNDSEGPVIHRHQS